MDVRMTYLYDLAECRYNMNVAHRLFHITIQVKVVTADTFHQATYLLMYKGYMYGGKHTCI